MALKLENCTNYIIPPQRACQITILTDKPRNYGVMDIDKNTLILSGCAIEAIYSAFIKKYPITIQDLIDGCNCGLDSLLRDLNTNNILDVTSNPPDMRILKKFQVNPGGIINIAERGDGYKDPIRAEYFGLVTVVQIGSSKVYFYEADVDFKCINEDAHVSEGAYAIENYGVFGTSIYPQVLKSSLGANCNICSVCNGCNACASCVLCEESNLSAQTISLVSLDSAVSISSAMNSFATKIQ